MKRILSIAVLAGLLTLSGQAIGVSTMTGMRSMDSPACATQAAEATTFRGIIKIIYEGAALFTDKAIYPLIGGDFKTIVGKEVDIVGTIVKEDYTEKIVVDRVQLDKMQLLHRQPKQLLINKESYPATFCVD